MRSNSQQHPLLLEISTALAGIYVTPKLRHKLTLFTAVLGIIQPRRGSLSPHCDPESHCKKPICASPTLSCRPLDTFSVEAIEQGGLLHHGRGHKQLPQWVSGHIVAASVRPLVTTADHNLDAWQRTNSPKLGIPTVPGTCSHAQTVPGADSDETAQTVAPAIQARLPGRGCGCAAVAACLRAWLRATLHMWSRQFGDVNVLQDTAQQI